MTLVAAWTRPVTRNGSIEELWLASDSRLGGGQHWDACPKIFTLPRTDAVLAFTGDTYYPYPIIEQIRIAIGNYPKSSTRALDISLTVSLIKNVLNSLINQIGRFPSNGDFAVRPSSFRLILCGYSWINQRFCAWKIYYDERSKQFTYYDINRQHNRLLTFDGLIVSQRVVYEA